jgi:hypothetical protein
VDRRRPVPRHRTVSVSGLSIVQVVCQMDLGTSVRGLRSLRIGHGEWLLVDLTPVSSATEFACGALVTVMDRISPDRFCFVAAARSPWVGEMLPRRARPVTFQSVGDALQMLVFARDGFGGRWLAGANGHCGALVEELTCK